MSSNRKTAWGQRSACFPPDTLDFEGQHHIKVCCDWSVKKDAFRSLWKYTNLLFGNIIQACKLRIFITSFCDPNYSYSLYISIVIITAFAILIPVNEVYNFISGGVSKLNMKFKESLKIWIIN